MKIFFSTTQVSRFSFLFYSIALFGLLCSTTFAQQTKYLLYFSDKGDGKTITITKNSPEWDMAVSLLTKASIERRIKHLGVDNFVDYDDLPVLQEYITGVKNIGVPIMNKLKWFNAISVYADKAQIELIAKLPFVTRIEKVRRLFVPRNEEVFGDENNKELIANNYSSEFFMNSIQKGPNFSYLDNNYNSFSSISDFFRSGDALEYGSSSKQLNMSEIPLVHNRNITGKGVKIGMLDTGFDWKKHESLKNAKVVGEYDFVNHDGNTANEGDDLPGQHSHGTYCFSVAGGFTNGKLIGVAFEAEFALAKTENTASETMIEEDNYAKALEFMDSLGVDITSSSLGYTKFDDTTYNFEDLNGKKSISSRAAEKAFKKGILTVTAAGNEGDKDWHFIGVPSDSKYMLAVGAVTSMRRLASFSSRGPTFDGRIKPDFSTMGVNIFGAKASTVKEYEFSNGTSAATPIAAGIAGLVLSANRYLKNSQLRHILLNSCTDYSYPDNFFGRGILSAMSALSYPNIEEKKNGDMILHKYFNSTNILAKSVNVFYSLDTKNFLHSTMKGDNEKGFTFALPALKTGDKVTFYFSYKDSLEQNLREPLAKEVYSLSSGDPNVYPPPQTSLNKAYSFTFKNSAQFFLKASQLLYVAQIINAETDLFQQKDGLARTVCFWRPGKDFKLINPAVFQTPLKGNEGEFYFVMKKGDKLYRKQSVSFRFGK